MTVTAGSAQGAAMPYMTSEVTDMTPWLGNPLRTRGCVVLVCTAGRAVVQCNFSRKAFTRGCVAVILADTLFSVERVSPGFSVKKFELSVSLADEATFLTSGAFFDWLDENQVCAVAPPMRRHLAAWLGGIDWIEHNATAGCRDVMARNHWHNFFLGFEAAVRPLIETAATRTISSSRRLFNRFCQLLCEHCRTRHDVRFYADRLCVTPYYLSKITYRNFRVSPKELIDRQLLMEIKSLLVSTHLTVKEIADSYGFDSASYLGRWFRRHTGLTPLAWRAQQSGPAAPAEHHTPGRP